MCPLYAILVCAKQFEGQTSIRSFLSVIFIIMVLEVIHACARCLVKASYDCILNQKQDAIESGPGIFCSVSNIVLFFRLVDGV